MSTNANTETLDVGLTPSTILEVFNKLEIPNSDFGQNQIIATWNEGNQLSKVIITNHTGSHE